MDIVSVEFTNPLTGRLTVGGLRDVEASGGEAVAVSCTCPEKPLTLANLTLERVEEFAATFTDVRLSAIPKPMVLAVMGWRWMMVPLVLLTVTA